MRPPRGGQSSSDSWKRSALALPFAALAALTAIWESGAILLYLAKRHDPECRLLSADPSPRWQAIPLWFFQAAGLGPNLGRLSDQLKRNQSMR